MGLFPGHGPGVVRMGPLRRSKPWGVNPPSLRPGLGWNGDVKHLVEEDEPDEPRGDFGVVEYRVDPNHGGDFRGAGTEPKRVLRTSGRPATPSNVGLDGLRKVGLLFGEERVQIVVPASGAPRARRIFPSREERA
jgi:hypothetical protein